MADPANQKTIESIRNLSEANSPSQWRVKDQTGVEYGPYTWDQLIQFAGEGRIARSSSVYHPTKTNGNWVVAWRIKQLADVIPQSSQGNAVGIEPEATQPIEPSADAQRLLAQLRQTPKPIRQKESWFDLFDWKFEKYAAVWVIRVIWVLFLMIWVCITCVYVGAMIVVPAVKGYQEITPAGQAAGLVLVLVAQFFGLLIARVFLESVIAIFNISKALNSINEKRNQI